MSVPDIFDAPVSMQFKEDALYECPFSVYKQSSDGSGVPELVPFRFYTRGGKFVTTDYRWNPWVFDLEGPLFSIILASEPKEVV